MAESQENEVLSKLQDIMALVKQNQILIQHQEEAISDLKETMSEQVKKQEAMQRQLNLQTSTALQLKRYTGSVTENARMFISDFESLGNYLHPSDEPARRRLFALYLAGRAKIWYEQHKVSCLPSWRAQREAFLTRFRPALQVELNALPQRKQQSIEDYIKVCGEKIFSLSITDEETKIQTFLDGLLPAYRDAVLEAQPSTLEQAERHALLTERNMKT